MTQMYCGSEPKKHSMKTNQRGQGEGEQSNLDSDQIIEPSVKAP